MTEQRRPRIPLPVVAAVSLLVLTVVGSVGALVTTPGATGIGLMVPVLVLVLAVGLCRGSGRARFWVTVLLTWSIVYGLVTLTSTDALSLVYIAGYATVVGLLLLPPSSRRWFHDVV
ncbi:hypothetical protein [Micromonospora sp. NPDC049891]|uniref:hypothetical protein n=1 Tax=Micromonospora sp. NPDC049891 TaxID=3155655 RepID=UPI00340AE621